MAKKRIKGDKCCDLFKSTFTDGYFISTIGEVSTETLRKYIQNQV